MANEILGLDIGGANLKAAHADGSARTVAFPLWKVPDKLAAALDDLLEDLPCADTLAVTMTGELCDCWESKRQGVQAILDAVEAVARSRTIHVWTNTGELVDLAQARERALEVASANWLALATFAGSFAPKGNALLLDIGTTTTDIIPLVDGKPRPRGRTDPQRLEKGELVYRGWKRTPVCALAGPSRAGEFFATLHDVYLTLKIVPEAPSDHDTADGRPATRVHANRRLARMLCGDLETTTPRECQALASEINYRFCIQIAQAIQAVKQALHGEVQTIVTSGSGEFLVSGVLTSAEFPLSFVEENIVSLRTLLGPMISAAACAYALARLCQEREG
jgi:hypothetical protein